MINAINSYNPNYHFKYYTTNLNDTDGTILRIPLWLLGIAVTLYEGYLIISGAVHVMMLLVYIPLSLLILMTGGMFIIAGKEIEYETDTAKIMLYAANVLALVSVIITIVSLFIEQ